MFIFFFIHILLIQPFTANSTASASTSTSSMIFVSTTTTTVTIFLKKVYKKGEYKHIFNFLFYKKLNNIKKMKMLPKSPVWCTWLGDCLQSTFYTYYTWQGSSVLSFHQHFSYHFVLPSFELKFQQSRVWCVESMNINVATCNE